MEHKITPITLSVTPTLGLLKDIVMIAVEGGIGYWSRMRTYKWQDKASGQELDFPVAVLEEIGEEDEAWPKYTITAEAVCKGLQLVLTPGIVHPASNTFRATYLALTENDASHIDSDAADNIVQLGLLGEIRYA